MLILATTAAVLWRQVALMGYLHLMFAVMWVGSDVFVAAVLDPVLFHMSLEAQQEFRRWFIPRMMLFNPTVAILTVVSGFGAAWWSGQVRWGRSLPPCLLATGALLVAMAVIGFGLIQPLNRFLYRTCSVTPYPTGDIRAAQRRVLHYARWQVLLQLSIVAIMFAM